MRETRGLYTKFALKKFEFDLNKNTVFDFQVKNAQSAHFLRFCQTKTHVHVTWPSSFWLKMPNAYFCLILFQSNDSATLSLTNYTHKDHLHFIRTSVQIDLSSIEITFKTLEIKYKCTYMFFFFNIKLVHAFLPSMG